VPVNDTKRRVDEFSQKRLAEFGDNATHIWMIGEGLDSFEDFQYQPGAHLWHALFCVPCADLFQIG